RRGGAAAGKRDARQGARRGRPDPGRAVAAPRDAGVADAGHAVALAFGRERPRGGDEGARRLVSCLVFGLVSGLALGLVGSAGTRGATGRRTAGATGRRTAGAAGAAVRAARTFAPGTPACVRGDRRRRRRSSLRRSVDLSGQGGRHPRPRADRSRLRRRVARQGLTARRPRASTIADRSQGRGLRCWEHDLVEDRFEAKLSEIEARYEEVAAEM